MKPPRRKLTDILGGDNGDNFRNRWDTTKAANDFSPLPSAEYTCRIVSGELFTARTGTAGYKMTLEVTEGEFEGRRAWHDLWLTPAALPMSKRDLAKVRITDPEQLERPFPPGVLVKVRLALRRDDDGNQVNKVTRFECIGVEPADPFAPSDPPADGGPEQ